MTRKLKILIATCFSLAVLSVSLTYFKIKIKQDFDIFITEDSIPRTYNFLNIFLPWNK